MFIKKLMLAALVMMSAPLAFAGKIVVFSPQAAIMGSEAAKKADKELKNNKEVAALVAKAESLRAEMESLSKEAEKKGMTWDAAKQGEHRKKMEYLNADYQLAVKKLQAEQKGMSEKLVRDMQPKLEQVLKEIQKEEGIDIVLHRQAVVLAQPESDITAKVVEKLNKLK